MPYARKRKSYVKKRSTTRKPALKRMVRREVMRSQETKDITFQYNSVAGANFGSVSYGASAVVAGFYGSITQGTGDGQRIGNALYARGINMRLALQPGDTINYMRILVVQPKGMGTPTQPSLTGPFVSSVLSGAAATGTQWLQPVDTDRWQVLFDKNYFLNFRPLDGSTATTTPTTRFVNKFIKVNRKIQWDHSNTVNNDVYIVAISDSLAVAHPGAVAGFFRVYYKDS